MRFSLLALLVRFGGSHRTGQAAPPHRNKHFEESNLKRFNNPMSVKVPPDIK